jgi:hypothetical protein
MADDGYFEDGFASVIQRAQNVAQDVFGAQPYYPDPNAVGLDGAEPSYAQDPTQPPLQPPRLPSRRDIHRG